MSIARQGICMEVANNQWDEVGWCLRSRSLDRLVLIGMNVANR